MRNMLLFIMFMLVSGIALGSTYNESGPGPIQDHTCQGGHNCNTNGHGTITGGDSSAVSSSSSAAAAVSSSSSSASADSSNVNLNVAEGGNAYANGGSAEQSQGQLQGQSQSSDNSNSSNNSASQNINIQGDKNVGEHENNWGNNVSAYAPAIYSSSACTAGGLSGGVSGLGFGVALGGAKQDPQCQVRENARVLASLDANLALLYMCANPLIDVGAVLGTACKPADAPVIVPHADPVPPVIPVPQIDDKVKG